MKDSRGASASPSRLPPSPRLGASGTRAVGSVGVPRIHGAPRPARRRPHLRRPSRASRRSGGRTVHATAA